MLADLGVIADDEWYRDIIEYKITGIFDLGENTVMSSARAKVIKIRSRRFVVYDTDPPKLGYKERNGQISRYISKGEVSRVLLLAYDEHGHFGGATILKRLRG